MQWLINLIKEVIHDQLGCFNRGDAPAWDFEVGDFVQDNTWRNMDLSGIIPETTRAVCFHLVVRATLIDIAINFRTKGNVSVFNVTRTACSIANLKNSVDVIVFPNADRMIEYKIFADRYNIINVCVAGWWL